MPKINERIVGAVQERSRRHVAGWVLNKHDQNSAVSVDAGIRHAGGFRKLQEVDAQQFRISPASRQDDPGSYYHGFTFALPAGSMLDEDEILSVRLTGSHENIPDAEKVKTIWEPVALVAMDITNNCNLRCPFCVSDYSDINRTRLMTPETFARMTELLPFTQEGGFFWLSCGHEATLHPRLLDYIESIKPALRKRVAFTTNLAKPMKEEYLDRLLTSGILRLNLSIDSIQDPAFSKLRKGGRLRIFRANLERLAAALIRAPQAPDIAVFSMAFKSNYTELPELVKWAREKLQVRHHFIRHPYILPHISADFLAEEELGYEDWTWLQEKLGNQQSAVMLRPKPLALPQETVGDRRNPQMVKAEQKAPVRPFNLTVAWNGMIDVNGVPLPGSEEPVSMHRFNLHDVRGPLIDYLMAL
ncbi:radical SAM protein [Limibacillus sp. MBR-115]|jgi:sulfatase maturation enzyme AslB (radical SAM superfamily)|uniref:radical SAM protein n=1 Tax=Limibacillus sp. MBR-115 TaxID=3156465 RepID=UPI0033943F02